MQKRLVATLPYVGEDEESHAGDCRAVFYFKHIRNVS